MEDIKLLETCPHCGTHITLMESMNVKNGNTYLVKRCLNCGNYPTTEVLLIEKAKKEEEPVEEAVDVVSVEDKDSYDAQHIESYKRQSVARLYYDKNGKLPSDEHTGCSCLSCGECPMDEGDNCLWITGKKGEEDTDGTI